MLKNRPKGVIRLILKKQKQKQKQKDVEMWIKTGLHLRNEMWILIFYFVKYRIYISNHVLFIHFKALGVIFMY